ncbi:MAG: hypothetical protein GY906_10035 [bacterium]|nr:hypothetical protein [bacterium]
MTTRTLRSSIDPILPPPRWRIGLFENSGAAPLPPEALDRLAGGVAYDPLIPYLDAQESSFDPCEETETEWRDGEDEDNIVEWNAWGIYDSQRCSTLSGQDGRIAAQEARVRALLAARSSYLGELSFWTGDVSGSSFGSMGWENVALTDAGNVTDLTPVDGEAGPVEAFGLINEYLAGTLQGVTGVIHVPAQLLPFLQFYGLVQREGFRLGTALSDHLVIAGSGYTGSGPGDVPQPNNRAWIYATSMVRTGMTDIEVRSSYNRARNKAEAIAFRSVLAEWDLSAHAGVRVCLTDPGPECAVAGS